MDSCLPELRLDLGPVNVPNTVSRFLREISAIGEISEKLMKLEDYVAQLEDEMRKIEAFRRELPLCMLLLKEAIMRLKEEAMQCRSDGRVGIEEFMPVKGNSGEIGEIKEGKDTGDKKEWMSSVQLWNTDITHENCDIKQSPPERKQRTENPFQQCNDRNMGRAFVPFKGSSVFPATVMKEADREVLQVPGLSLMTSGLPTQISELSCPNSNPNSCSRSGSGSPLAADHSKAQNKPQQQQQQQQQQLQQTLRKQRRCWSPELHRRFVDALQLLGGWQAATPKQIRELMQVDGLTNDEVKSHLQKYRLHVRRLPASSAAQANGLWMTQDHCTDLSKRNITQSGSPEGPLHLSGSAKGIDGMEEEDDERSESLNCKGRLDRPKEDHDV